MTEFIIEPDDALMLISGECTPQELLSDTQNDIEYVVQAMNYASNLFLNHNDMWECKPYNPEMSAYERQERSFDAY